MHDGLVENEGAVLVGDCSHSAAASIPAQLQDARLEVVAEDDLKDAN